MRQPRRMIKLAATTLFAVMLPVSTAIAAPASELGTTGKCGFYKDNVTAWYNHCTSDGSHIWVQIDYASGDDKYRCLGPGITDIGGANDINNAWYSGRLCSTR